MNGCSYIDPTIKLPFLGKTTSTKTNLTFLANKWQGHDKFCKNVSC